MDISFAGFDWISLLVIIVAGIIGMIKSNSANKKKQYPVFPLPFEEEEEDEKIEDYTIPMEYKATEPGEMETEISGDYYPEKRTMPDLPVAESPEEEAQAPAFDIRQAVISSEILKRPEF